MTAKSKIVRMLGASAVTAFPFVFVDPSLGPTELEATLTHERVHLAQQRRWSIYGLGIGLLVWWLLYLVAQPVGWNPLRRRAETEAYVACEFTQEEIDELLRGRPYWLWW